MPPAYCPHCMLPVADDVAMPFPPRTMRCPHCRLAVAAGRARSVAVSGTGSGGAAGVLVNAARRADATAVAPEAVAEALATVAAQAGVPVGRLRMLDYQQLSETDPGLPDLSTVIATCGSWKRARQLASETGTS